VYPTRVLAKDLLGLIVGVSGATEKRAFIRAQGIADAVRYG
jgi:hypothetical protein